jgi:GNAT superfamily N-acetyltransferase
MQPDTQTINDWQLEVNPPRETVESLRDNLRRFNGETGQTHEGMGLGIFFRNEEQEMIGGVSAWLWGTTLEIDYLWLAEELRGRGLGQQLMAHIEKAAVERGANQATLSTFTFQAPDFYQKLGYEVVATIDGLGNGHKKFFLRKSL